MLLKFIANSSHQRSHLKSRTSGTQASCLESRLVQKKMVLVQLVAPAPLRVLQRHQANHQT